MKECESCGMVMIEKDDFGNEDFNNIYCVYCTDKDGQLKSFDQKLNELSDLIRKRMHTTKGVARKLARQKLMKYPAWKNRKF